MTNSVVVTRPQAQAEVLARRLRAAGRAVICFPLLEIHPLSDTTSLTAVLQRLEDYALVAFVSPNAIDAAFACRREWPHRVPLAVMGEGSRATLAQHGVTDADYSISRPRQSERNDSETLLAALDLDNLRGRRVLIVRGESGRELLGDALHGAGIAVEQVAAYRRVAPALTRQRAQQLTALLETGNEWLITSSEALRNLMDAVQQVAPNDGVAKIFRQNIFVPHQRIAETAQHFGFTRVFLTAAGDDGLLTALQFML